MPEEETREDIIKLINNEEPVKETIIEEEVKEQIKEEEIKPKAKANSKSRAKPTIKIVQCPDCSTLHFLLLLIVLV